MNKIVAIAMIILFLWIPYLAKVRGLSSKYGTIFGPEGQVLREIPYRGTITKSRVLREMLELMEKRKSLMLPETRERLVDIILQDLEKEGYKINW